MHLIADRIRRPLACLAVLSGLLTLAPAAQALNCVQYVQKTGTVNLRGDAYQWWDHAAGVYNRGKAPGTGSVMVFSRTPTLPHGHVAVVRKVTGSRTVLVDHANWSPVHGRRGQVEHLVSVVDVSPRNDWSQVRVWFRPTSDLGSKVYPVTGFIYPVTPRHHAR